MIKSPSHFEQLMDGAVGKALKVKAWRHGNTLEYELHVEDLWTITPCRLLQFAGASFQDLGYQEALKYHVPAGGVTVADAEGSFEGLRKTTIRSLNNQNTSNLGAFISIARKIPDQARVAVEYQTHDSDLKSRFQRITVDRRWLREDMILRSRKGDDTASWHVQDLGPPSAAVSQPPQVLLEGQKTEWPIVQKITPNMVYVHAGTPYETDGTRSQEVKYMGLVINASKGLVITA
ncbi:hypothetical protein N7G274_010671 [Stereocaulon virgatum]|uniref:PDZ-like domain-containing protein n=1 Tax=Stereocaulon virgatum TaxID=373712 RepID=A0ABR3ZT31_9LECA